MSFRIPDDDDFKGSPYPMIPDTGTDEEKAMADVNPDIVVTSNTTAIITPTFIENAPGIGLLEGENMPFARVTWRLLQSEVVNDGATFMIQRTTMSANQEMEPSGDVTYWTCGPFECIEGEDAPMIGIANSAACEGWMATLDIDVGLIDNDRISHLGRAAVSDDLGTSETDETVVGVRVFDGLDLGWIYTSTDKFNAKHDLAVVNKTTTGIAKKSSGTELPSESVGRISLGTHGGHDLRADLLRHVEAA